MALDNLVSIAFTDPELADINDALTTIDTTASPKLLNLTPEERQQYGKVRYEMEVWIKKVYDYMVANPTLVPAYIDLPEHRKDIEAREDMRPIQEKLTQLHEKFDDTFIVIGHDLYVNSLSFYRNLKAAAQANVPGATSIYEELKKQFPGGKKPATPTPPPGP